MDKKTTIEGLYKTIGFFNYNSSEVKNIKDKMERYTLDDNDKKFLNNSYHSEYINIMFENSTVERLYRELDYELKIEKLNISIQLNKLEIFLFNEDFKKEKLGIFSLSYNIENRNIENLSDISNALNRYDTSIIYKKKTYKLKEFISENILNNKRFYEENSPSEQYLGSKFKNYIVIDFDHDQAKRDDLLYEIGTCSPIGTIKRNELNSPTLSYKNKMLENSIACFKNYTGLALLDSFTVVGFNNYKKQEIYSHKGWDDIYYSIYIFNLYMKCTLQMLSNDFSKNPMNKRKEFQKFYNSCFYNKIAFNFLPNELHHCMGKGLEIQDDINFISNRLDTLATQINENQQKQQELLLLVISVIALIEIPLLLDSFREMLGIENIILYNICVYLLLFTTIISFILIKIKHIKNK